MIWNLNSLIVLNILAELSYEKSEYTFLDIKISILTEFCILGILQ